MNLPDANILLYAYNSDAAEHEKCREWLENQLSGTDLIGFGWQTITAFLRISTNARAFPNPLTPTEATEIVSDWLEVPNARILLPAENHWTIIKNLITVGQIKAAMIMDAHLAALAIEHNAVLITTDSDFSRFSGLKTINPLQS